MILLLHPVLQSPPCLHSVNYFCCSHTAHYPTLERWHPYTRLGENVPTLASCSFDQHGLIFINFGRQCHRITMFLFFLSLHFCLLCFWITVKEMTRCRRRSVFVSDDVQPRRTRFWSKVCMNWKDIPPKPGYQIWGLMQERLYLTAILSTSNMKQRLIDAWASTSQKIDDEAVDNVESSYMQVNGHHFEHWLN